MIPRETLLSLLRYEANSGKLFWRVRGIQWFDSCLDPVGYCRSWNKRYAGREALTFRNSEGYCEGTVLGKFVQAHRVIWLMETGEWPEKIDHQDGVTDNNRLSNLRAVDGIENNKNRRMSKNNTSGVMGVTWNRKVGKWQALIREGRKTHYLGVFHNLADAAAARKNAELKLGFHANHGRQQVPA